MPLQGKGFFIWKIRDCEGGSPEKIAAAAHAAGMTHVLLKIADGSYPFNIARETAADLVPPVVAALKAKGLHAWGWQYVYGYDPQGEAQMAIKRIKQLGLDGFVIDAESEFKLPGRADAARRYAQELRSAFPKLPLALSSFRFPSYHRAFPWSEFLEVCNLNMPQVYWEKAHNPAAQLKRCVAELTALEPSLPVVPTGPAYKTGGWRPGPQEMVEFLTCARELKLQAANFFSWDECRRDLPELWQAISAHPWKVPAIPTLAASSPAGPSLAERFLQALRKRSLEEILALYHKDAVHVSEQRTVKGQEALREWYQALWEKVLPEAELTIETSASSPSQCRFTWKARPKTAGKIEEGQDILGLIDGKIVCHYTQIPLD